ncbi:MAG: hypothetical protein ACOX87_07800 [Chloroflexota bacterium]|jgi:hypothetical protein
MNEREKEEYDLMMELEQLESLKEEMEELGVTNLAEIKARMEELNRELDEMHRER